MKQCLHITFLLRAPKKILQTVVQKAARDLEIEGTAQSSGTESLTIMIVACGVKERLSEFIDILHKEAVQKNIEDLQIEPFIKVKDYRGVFRVIE